MPEDTLPAAFFKKFPNAILKTRLTRVWGQIIKTWGTEEGIAYLNSLLLVEDGRSRQGFDGDIMSELFYLEDLHERQFPEFPSSEKDRSYSFANDHAVVADI